MLKSMEAALINGQPTASGVVSRTLSLALQDATQVALVISFVILGWLLVSVLLHAMGVGAVTAAQKQKLAYKLTEPAPKPQESENARAGLALLEHYGVFGSRPGAWTDACNSRSKPHLTLEDLPADTDPNAAIHAKLQGLSSNQSPFLPQRVLGSRTPRGRTLLQQYGVLGVSPKCWQDSTIDGFGDILTSIS